MWRYYLVPAATDQTGAITYRQPAVVRGFVLPAGLDVPNGSMPWGRDNRFLLAADVTAGQHTTIAAAAGVQPLPLPDDNPLSSTEQTKAIAYCAGIGLPSSWITASETGRTTLKTFAGIALVLQRFNGRARAGVAGKLGLLVGDLAAAQRDHLLAVADDLELTRGGITASSTIGDLLVEWGRQFVGRPLVLGPQVL